MPSYELSLIYRALPKAELKTAIRRTAECIMNEGGVLRKLESLGTQNLPHVIRKDGIRHKQGSYFLFYFDSPASLVSQMLEEYKRDVDVIRPAFTNLGLNESKVKIECSLESELLPAAYRPEVQKLIKEGRKKAPKRFKMHVDFYPF